MKKKITKKIYKYLIEFILIVSGVFIGLFLNKTSEKASNLKLAKIVRENFIREIDSNKVEIERILHIHNGLYEKFLEYLNELDAKESRRNYNISIEIPEITKAAWESAIATKGIIYLKNEEIISLSKCYELQDLLKNFNERLIDVIFSKNLLINSNNNKISKHDLELEIKYILTTISMVIQIEESTIKNYENTLKILLNNKIK